MYSKKIEMWYPTKIDSTRDDGLFYVVDSTPSTFLLWCQTQRQGNYLGFQPILHCAKGSRLEPTHLQQEGGAGWLGSMGTIWELHFPYFPMIRWLPNSTDIGAAFRATRDVFASTHTHTHFLRTAYRFVKVECIGRATDTNKQKQIDTVNTYNYI